MRCHELEEERDALRAEMDSKQNDFNQLELEHNKDRQTWEEEKKDREMKITELNEAYNQLNVLHLNQENELEQNKTLMKEESERKAKLIKEKEKIEKELAKTKAKLDDQEKLEERRVEAVRSKERFKKVNEQYSQSIKKLTEKNKALGKKNEDLLKEIETFHEAEECDKLRAERDQLKSKIDRLVQEADESRLNCRKLEEEVIKCRNFVCRKYKLWRFIKASRLSYFPKYGKNKFPCFYFPILGNQLDIFCRIVVEAAVRINSNTIENNLIVL